MYRKRKQNQASPTAKGLEFNGLYGYTNDILPTESPDKLPPIAGSSSNKQQLPAQNDDIYFNINDNENEYTYADVKSDALYGDKQKDVDEAKDLVVIYAKSKYGGRAKEDPTSNPSHKFPPKASPSSNKPQRSGKDEIYFDTNEDKNEYAYADAKSNALHDDTGKDVQDTNDLVEIYAKSEYGGRVQVDPTFCPCESTDYAYATPSEITNQHKNNNSDKHDPSNDLSNDYIYANCVSVTDLQRTNQTEASNENEGWEDNEIYAVEKNVEIKEDQEGWADNSIYANSDKGPDTKVTNDEDEGWEDNVVYSTTENN